MEITEIKERLTLAEVIKSYGLKADKYNRINCPFHEDKTPSMQLYWKTHTAYCFSSNCPTHGGSLDVIDFVMHIEKSNKHEAIEKCKKMLNGHAVSSGTACLPDKAFRTYKYVHILQKCRSQQQACPAVSSKPQS